MSDNAPQMLTLSVTGNQAGSLGSRSQRIFAGKDGTIGRSEDCDWVLSGSGVSRVHAVVHCLNGMYFIEDRSSNGMLLNGKSLLKGDPSALKDGDRIQIDVFDIAVRLQVGTENIAPAAREAVQTPAPVAKAPAPETAAFDAAFLDFGMPAAAPAAPAAPAPFGGDDLISAAPAAPAFFGGDDLIPAAPAAPIHPGSDSLIPGTPVGNADELDPLNLLGGFGSPEPSPVTPPAPSPSWNHSAGTEDYFRPPATDVQRKSGALPDNWDAEFADLAPPAAAPPPPPPPAMAPRPAAPPPMPEPIAPQPVQTPRPVAAPIAAAAPVAAPAGEIDAIFRIVVDGVMDVLRARAEIKNTFRLPVTVIQRSENNPLKFAMGVDEAMQKIMSPPNAAFLSGTAAFDDAFDDIRCHQMAMLAGVRAGFDSLLRHFSPENFEREADAGGRHAFGGKGRYWERFREHYTGLAGDPDECFRRLFGDEFARAYEDQLARLKSARRARSASAR